MLSKTGILKTRALQPKNEIKQKKEQSQAKQKVWLAKKSSRRG